MLEFTCLIFTIGGQTSSTIGSSTNQSSSAASATSASAAHNQRGSLRVGLASRNTGAQVSGKRKKIVRCKTKGKNMGRWGNKDNNRKRVRLNTIMALSATDFLTT